MKVRPYFTIEKVQKLAENIPYLQYTLLTIPDPRSHYRNDTVVLIFCFNRAQSPPNLHQTLT